MSNNQMVEKKILDLGGVPTVDKVGVEERVARFQSRSIKKESKMLGLKMGADDYIKKPFSQRLLIERIKTILRRMDAIKKVKSEDEDDGGVVVRGRLKIDPVRHICDWDGKDVKLTFTEFLILQALVQHPGHVKSRYQLMDVAYNDDIYVDDRTIDSHIKRLRKKFRKVDNKYDGIETLYGVGYRYSES